MGTNKSKLKADVSVLKQEKFKPLFGFGTNGQAEAKQQQQTQPGCIGNAANGRIVSELSKQNCKNGRCNNYHPEQRQNGITSMQPETSNGYATNYGNSVQCNMPSTIGRHKIRGRRHREVFDSRITEKYDVKALIGKGSFSRVIRVEHRGSRQPYALKIVELSQGARFLDNELSILARIRHPYIVQMLEMFRDASRVYMVMELATGGDLFDKIVSRGFLPEAECIKILHMLLEALAYLHSLAITHRDLKPENVLYFHPGHDSKILLSDFGLAHQCHPENDPLMRTTCGTPEYIAPEVLLRQAYSNKVDVWALGVVTYIMLSGTMPFDDDSRTRIYRAILKAKYEFPDEFWTEVSDEAIHFVRTLLDPEPARRPSIMQIMRHPWICKSMKQPPEAKTPRGLHKSYSHQPKEPHRTRSSKSVRSIARSDAGHRVQPEELDRLQKDPEFQRLLLKYSVPNVGGDGGVKMPFGSAAGAPRIIAVV